MVKKGKKKSPSLFSLKNILGVIFIIAFVSAGLWVSAYFQISDPVDSSQDTNNLTQNGSELLIINPENCITCQSELFATSLKENLFPNLTISKAPAQAPDSQSLIEQLDAKYLPIYLFTQDISEASRWNDIEQGFEKVSINGEAFYYLKAEFSPGRVLVNDLKVLEGAVVLGEDDAPLTLYEFSDFGCPFCAVIHGNENLTQEFKKQQDSTFTSTFPNLYEDYIETGKVRYVFYNFPQETLHTRARDAHNAALCANEQGYWREYSNYLFTQREEWILSSDLAATLVVAADNLGLDTNEFSACYAQKRYDEQITQEQELAQEIGVRGNPTFFIGKTFLSGPIDYDIIKILIDQQLQE